MTDDGQGSRPSAYGSADEAEVPGPPAPPTPRAVFKLEAPAPRPERSVAIEQCLRKLVDDLRAGQLEARLLEELRAGREGSFRRGALCEVRQGETCYPGARIDAYDDETGTYTVRRFDTGPRGRGLLMYVEEGEVRGVSYW